MAVSEHDDVNDHQIMSNDHGLSLLLAETRQIFGATGVSACQLREQRLQDAATRVDEPALSERRLLMKTRSFSPVVDLKQ